MSNRSTTVALGALALALAGCSGGQQPTDDNASAAAMNVPGNDVTTVTESDAPDTADTTTAPPSSGLNNSDAAPAPAPAPTPTPSPTASTAAAAPDDSGTGPAAEVVRSYYAAIDHGEYRAAYQLWGNDGQDSHQSFTKFRQGFARTATTSVAVGQPGDSEGAAGSIYITVPVTVRAQLKDRTQQRFTGHYVLRRVNDVPGSTAAQRRWHLYSADLRRS
ncbi:MAG: hypothetical protein ACTHMG_14335 [Sphingomonas sp.]